MNHTAEHHYGLGLAIIFGIFTALAATVAIAVRANDVETDSDTFERWDDILGI